MNLRPSIVTALATFALVPLAHAGSLRNGDFQVNLAHWATTPVPNVSATRVAEDAEGQAGSGSAEIRDANISNGGVQIVLSQCVDIRGQATPIPLAASARVLLEGLSEVTAQVVINQFADPECQTSLGHMATFFPVNNSLPTWQTISDSFTPAASIQSVRIQLGIEKDLGDGVGGAVRFDRLSFGVPAPELTRWTIDSGGGYLTGGNYVLHGTVGQPDPGSASAGGTTLQSGFWFGAAAPPEDALFKDGFET